MHNQTLRTPVSLLYAAVLLAGMAGGTLLSRSALAATPCGGLYCTADTSGCTNQGQSVEDPCCKDLDGDGQRHCVTCTRDYYLCLGSELLLGNGYNCRNPAEACL